MATIRKRAWINLAGDRKEAWRVRYVDQTGTTRTRQFHLKRDADAFRIQAEGEVASGVHTPDRASITVSAAADLWLAAAEANGCDRGTLKTYGEMAERHIKPLVGAEKLSRLTMPRVEAFADAMKASRSIAMASKAVRALSMIVAEAQRRGLVSQNVARSVTVKRSTRDRRKIVIPSREHLRAMLSAADQLGGAEPALPVLLRVAMLTGLRSSELRGLSWPDIDLTAGAVSVSQRADRWNDLGPPKSEAGRRTIPIGPDLVKQLRAWKLRCRPSPAALVFPSDAGTPMTQHRLIDRFTSVQIAAGLATRAPAREGEQEGAWKPRYGMHALRHAAASAWIAQRIDLKRLQVWIGHATIQLTLDTYGHLLTDASADAALAGGSEAALLG